MTEKNQCSKIKRAYMIPVFMHEDIPYIMVMRPSNKNFGGSEYQIAKGRIDPGELPQQTAIRECNEELGLDVSNCDVQTLGLYFNDTGEVFFAIVKNCEQTSKPCFETVHTAWLSIDEFFHIGRPLQKGIIKDLYNRLRIIELI